MYGVVVMDNITAIWHPFGHLYVTFWIPVVLAITDPVTNLRIVFLDTGRLYMENKYIEVSKSLDAWYSRTLHINIPMSCGMLMVNIRPFFLYLLGYIALGEIF